MKEGTIKTIHEVKRHVWSFMYRQILHSLANFTFTMSVSRYSFLNFKVIVGIAKDDKWYSAIDSKSLFWDKNKTD